MNNRVGYLRKERIQNANIILALIFKILLSWWWSLPVVRSVEFSGSIKFDKRRSSKDLAKLTIIREYVKCCRMCALSHYDWRAIYRVKVLLCFHSYDWRWRRGDLSSRPRVLQNCERASKEQCLPRRIESRRQVFLTTRTRRRHIANVSGKSRLRADAVGDKSVSRVVAINIIWGAIRLESKMNFKKVCPLSKQWIHFLQQYPAVLEQSYY